MALDGTVVTGDATLEAIFDVGGGSEYFNLDLIAPDVLGTRTLIDMGERVLAAQSSGGENDTMAEVLEDRLQGHWHITNLGDGLDTIADANQVQGKNTFQTAGTNATRDPIDDGTNGTPKTGLTTRPKELTTGISYIIVMKAA